MHSISAVDLRCLSMRVVEDSQQDNNQHLPGGVIGSSQTQERPNCCDASEILDERDSRFLIAWTGNNPDTDRPWTPSWVGLKLST